MQRFLKRSFVLILIPMLPVFGADTSTYEGFLPKHITGVRSFLEKHPDYDGRGIRVAVLDSGVDPGATGLEKTSQGQPKVIDILDATGSGDVDTSKTAQASEDGTLNGISGRKLTLDSSWLKPDRTFHLGMVRMADLVTASVWRLYEEEAKETMSETNKVYIQAIESKLEHLASNQELTKEQQETQREELETRLRLLEKMEKDFSPASPIYDCLVFKDEDLWKVVIDTNENGDLSDDTLLDEYSINQAYASFGPSDLVHYGVHVYNEGDLLSIVIPSSAHGTHVAGMIGAYYPNAPERNGIAPGVQIVSIKIGDTHLEGMETGIALQRALRMVRDLDCDLINMSYGEPTSLPNQGWFFDQVDALVREHNVVYVASAGNAGPALSSVGAPGGASSSILAIGAYVHQSMMPLQYGMSHSPQSNLYTWSSRGPTLDGDLGVNLCAPGGAIAPVPHSSLQPAMQMNGTSMASPYACGSIALLLSGLKQEDIPWQSYGVRTALEHSAQFMDHIDRFSQGAGLIQVESAFELLSESKQSDVLWGYAIRNASQSSGRGNYLREAADLETPSRHTIGIEPIFYEEVSTAQKSKFEVWAKLESDADWIAFPDSALIHQDGGRVIVLVDATSLDPGAYSSFIQGRDMHTGTPLFRIPVHVLVPETSHRTWQKSLSLKPGDVARAFLTPPGWAQWAEFTIEGDTTASPDRLALHTTQLEPKNLFNKHEWKRYIGAASLKKYQASIPVVGNRTMDWTFASYWSNRSDLDLRVRIQFRGVGQVQSSLHVQSGDTVVSIQAQGIEKPIHLSPRGNLTEHLFSMLPTKSSVKSSDDPRDRLVTDEMLSRLELVYQWENTQGRPITPEWNALSEVLYDSPYSSLLWRLEDAKGRLLVMDDAWATPVSAPKGPLTLKLNIWHEDESLLNRLKNMPITLSQRLEKTIPIQIHSSLTNAISLKSGSSASKTLETGETEQLWLLIQGNKDPKPEANDVTSTYAGNIQWLDSAAHQEATLNTVVTWTPTRRPAGTRDHATDETSISDLAEAIWQTKLKHLRSLGKAVSSIEAFNGQYAALRKERPYSEELDQILLEHLETDHQASNLASRILHLNDMLSGIQTQEIRTYFSRRHPLKSKEEKKMDKSMKEKRERYIDLLYRKTRALAFQESATDQRSKAFEQSLSDLRTWVDTSSGIYRNLEVWEAHREESFGRALDQLLPLLQENKNDSKYLQKHKNLLEAMGWTFWVNHFRLSHKQRFPNDLTLIAPSN